MWKYWTHKYVKLMNFVQQLGILTFITPGQFGPTRRVLLWLTSLCLTLTISCWGMPSVMQTTKGISASIASETAAAAPGAGT